MRGVIHTTLGTASILTMALIAFNRYFRVVKPEHLYTRLFPSKKMALVYCAFIWIASVLLATPPLYGWGKMAYLPAYGACTFNRKVEDISYVIVLMNGVHNTNTAAIFYCYYKIYKTLKKSRQNLNAHGATSSERPRTDIRVLKTCFTVVCVFLILWGPVTVVVVMESAEYFVPREVSTAVFFLVFTTSLVNPIIYGVMNPQLRTAFKGALSFGRCGNQIHPTGQP